MKRLSVDFCNATECNNILERSNKSDSVPFAWCFCAAVLSVRILFFAFGHSTTVGISISVPLPIFFLFLSLSQFYHQLKQSVAKFS